MTKSDPKSDSKDPARTEEPPPAAEGAKDRARPLAPVTAPDFGSPIVDELHVKRFELLYRRLPVGARVARVFVTRSGNCLTYPATGQPTTGELVWNKVRTVYEVDLGIHVSTVKAHLPSRGDKIYFKATVDLEWKVTDPAQVVQAGVTDVRKVLSPRLLARLRAVTRRFDIEDAAQAENCANEELEDDSLGADRGLWVRPHVRLAMDDTSLGQSDIQRKVDHFRTIIAEGDFDQFALQLTLKPEDIDSVVKVLVDERDSRLRATFDFMNRLLESDALDRWQIDDQVRTALQMAQESIFRVLTGSGQPRLVSSGETIREPVASGNGSASLP
ncbi:hypothetical protein [Saccharothrix yanglingensis]|uniref:Band 7 domain-containing protein n=1 Tax=Saccharothrix yanglingensis TaxID=659496 RepID=A0ABU0XAL6_9PSEU|nr:hypothetical protein [Saccharothrix yanglingensis]MDQ2589135.1 hypothetical protein [Saccharothrix yanglingensis]